MPRVSLRAASCVHYRLVAGVRHAPCGAAIRGNVGTVIPPGAGDLRRGKPFDHRWQGLVRRQLLRADARCVAPSLRQVAVTNQIRPRAAFLDARDTRLARSLVHGVECRPLVNHHGAVAEAVVRVGGQDEVPASVPLVGAARRAMSIVRSEKHLLQTRQLFVRCSWAPILQGVELAKALRPVACREKAMGVHPLRPSPATNQE